MKTQFSKYCTPWVEVSLIKPKYSLTGSYIFSIEKDYESNFNEAFLIALATFCFYYFDQEAETWFPSYFKNITQDDYKELNKGQYSDESINHLLFANPDYIPKFHQGYEDISSIISVEGDNNYTFFYSVTYD